jgi:hypothetical protein
VYRFSSPLYFFQ